MRTRLVLALIGMGLGLVVAPSIFSMWKRAPLGAQMISEFQPFMTDATVKKFTGYMSSIGRAHTEASQVRQLIHINDEELASTYPGTLAFIDQWPRIDRDMRQMLGTMDANLENFAAVDALPPFNLFPWFFVVPGLVVAVWSALVLKRLKANNLRIPHLVLLGVIGFGLIAAPFVFKMFTRAPLGGQMIDEFVPLMKPDQVAQVQQYFLVIGGGEGELRNTVRPQVIDRFGWSESEYNDRFPEIAAFHRDFGRVSGDMAPMIGVMSDNLDNFEAVAALPPFPLFPFFFVIPGAFIVILSSIVAFSWRTSTQVIVKTDPISLSTLGILLIAALIMGACGRQEIDTPTGSSLEGLFRVAPGECSDEGVTRGSYFRMINIGGNPDDGPFVTNNDSPCGDKTYTPLKPGSAGGLLTGHHQPLPDPPFDQENNGAANSILEPQAWFAIKFAVSTNSTDPQTDTRVQLPSISIEGNSIKGDLRAFAASWNGTHFNQGAPKPDGSVPGNTKMPEGTYEESGGAYTLDWRSQIVGGPFNNFTGVWHFEGTYEEPTNASASLGRNEAVSVVHLMPPLGVFALGQFSRSRFI